MIHDKRLLFLGSIREICFVCQAKFSLMMLWLFILFLLFPLATVEITVVSVHNMIGPKGKDGLENEDTGYIKASSGCHRDS